MRADHKQTRAYWDKTLNEFFKRIGSAKGFDASVYERTKFEKEAKELINNLKRQYSKYDVQYDGGIDFIIDGYYYMVQREGKSYIAYFMHSVKK